MFTLFVEYFGFGHVNLGKEGVFDQKRSVFLWTEHFVEDRISMFDHRKRSFEFSLGESYFGQKKIALGSF